MTHTIRIYNNPNLKKTQRYNVDDKTNVDPLLGCLLSYPVGIPYTRRSWICMGHCESCRDHNKDQRKLRKQRKEQFRFELKNEV